MRVHLNPPAWATHLLSDLTDWRRRPLPVAEVVPFILPDDAYFEYAYRDAAGELRPDPANPHPRLNPWWTYACHLVGPDYRPDPLARASTGAARGELVRRALESRQLGQRRTYYLYSPPGCAGRALPHILFQDGKAYLGWGRVAQILDRLVAAGEVRPAHLVLVPPVERSREYAFDADYRRFLVEEVLPHAEALRPCNDERVAWGASLGGLLAAVLAWEHPERFATVVAQSGAFLYHPGQDLRDPFAGDEWFLDQVRDSALRPLRWCLDCGGLEWLQASNARLASALRDMGYEVRWSVRSAGHNWVNWRNGVAGALRFALGAEPGREPPGTHPRRRT